MELQFEKQVKSIIAQFKEGSDDSKLSIDEAIYLSEVIRAEIFLIENIINYSDYNDSLDKAVLRSFKIKKVEG